MYQEITAKIIKDLQNIFGTGNVLSGEKDTGPYARDESPGLEFPPGAVVMPHSEEQLQELARYSRKKKIPLTARGGGTSLTGAPLPVMGGVVVSFEKMNRILDIDPSSRMARVQPGVITGNLDREAAKEKLFYPVNPASLDSCTLGGNAATAAGGANTVKYGTTRNYLCGIRAVDGNSALWEAGGKVVKNSTDSQLIQLTAGSEGTLSLFSLLSFRLVERPAESAWIIAPFKDIKEIPAAARKIFSLAVNPTMVELMDAETLACCREYSGEEIPFHDFNQLLVRLDFAPQSNSQDILITAGESCMDSGAEDVFIADTSARQEKIWKIRSSIHDAIEEIRGSVCEEDVVVPPGRVGELLEEAKIISEQNGFKVALYGHLGDGNIHVNFTGRGAPEEKKEQMKSGIFRAALKLGGKLSGEHGIGLTKKTYFNKYVDRNYLRLLKRIKTDFDPENILNPGKIF